MSLDAYRHAWTCAPDLTGGQFKVLMYLAECHNGQTGRCCPSLLAIIAATGLTRSNVQRSLYALEQAGAVTVDRTPGRVSGYWFPPRALSTTRRADAATRTDVPAAQTRPPRRAHAATPAAHTRPVTGSESEWNRAPDTSTDEIAPAGTDVRRIMKDAAKAERQERTG